jgi:hypothetical protein
MFAGLNRRHKTGLFLVLVGAGLALLTGAPWRETVGAALLGLAVTWLLGSPSLRALAFSLSLIGCLLGVSLVALPILNDWSDARRSARSYDSAVSAIRQAIAEAQVEQIGGASRRVVTIPAAAKAWYGPWGHYDTSTRLLYPADASDERIRLHMVSKLLPRPAFSVRETLFSHRVPIGGGVSLLVLGLSGLAATLFRARKPGTPPVAWRDE